MIDYLQRLADISLPVFVVSTMLAVGMSQHLADVVAPLKRPGPVALTLLVNFVISPAMAVALSRLVPLQPAHATGLLLLSAAAGAPILPKLAEISLGSMAYSVALTVLLMGASIVLMPLILPLMLPGFDADPWPMAKPLLLILLMPLAIGFALALCMPAWTKVLLPAVRTASNIALLALIGLTIALNLKTVLGTFGSFAVATYVVYLLALFGAAYLIGAIDRPTRAVFALGAASRNVAAALVVASASLKDPGVTVMLVIALVVSNILLFPLARRMRPKP